MHIKYLHIGLYEVIAFVVVVLAVLLRIVLVYLGWPQTDSDEGTLGLMALHIAYHGAHPLVLYGQDYIGTLQAYLGAGLFHLFGASLFILRQSSLILFTLFLICMYILISMLYSRGLALVTLLMLSIGPSEVLFNQLEAVGGFIEVLLFGTILLLLALWLARTSRTDPLKKLSWKRVVAYPIWGLTVGVALWSNPVVLPFVVAAGLLIALFCRSELRVPVITLLVLGVLVGLAPQLIYKITVPTDPNALSLFGTGYQVDTIGSTAAPITPSPTLQFAGTILVGLPIATGGNTLCPLNPSTAWPLSSQADAHTIQCTVVHGLWSVGFITLLILSALLTARQYWKRWRQSTPELDKKSVWRQWLQAPTPSSSLKHRQTAVRQFARLALLISAGLTLLLYMLLPQSAVNPWSSSRYLIGLLIALPAVLWPLWTRFQGKGPLPVRAGIQSFRYALLVLIGGVFLVGTINVFGQISTVQVRTHQQYTLIENLLSMGATHIYSDYQTCNRMAFQSNEQIVCSVLDEHLQPGLDRYLPYRVAVAHAAQAYYVFPDPSPQASALDLKAPTTKTHYRRLIFDGYVVYQPL